MGDRNRRQENVTTAAEGTVNFINKMGHRVPSVTHVCAGSMGVATNPDGGDSL